MKNFVSSILTILFISSLIGWFYFSNSQTTILTEDVSSTSMHPAWAEEWAMFKEEGAIDVPNNLTSYYRNNLYEKNINFRSGDALVNIQELGPDNIAGRTRAFLINAANTDHYMAGSISGGLWESFDRGESWVPKSDKDENLTVSFIAQNPFNPDIIYYSTGEVTGNSAGVNGVGVFKSINGGKTFELLPASEQNGLFATWRVECSKTDSATLYIASSSGLYVSRDHGDSFDQVLFQQCTDIELLPDTTLLIGIRQQGVFIAHESSPGTTTKLNIPLRVNSNFNRVEMAYCATSPNTMYAAFEDRASRKLLNIARSDDGGMTWDTTNSTGISTNYTWYCHALAVHPKDPNLVLYGSVGAGYSTDGGETWKILTGSHADKHLFVFHPDEDDLMYICSDGGIDEYVLENKSYSFAFRLNNGYNITQFYTGAFYPNEDRAIGGTQDNGTLRSPKKGMTYDKIRGGDGAYCDIDQNNPKRAMSSFQNAKIYVTDNFEAVRIKWRYIMKDLENNDKKIPSAYFINPVFFNPYDSDQIIFIKRNGVWLSPDYGKTWKKISGNLTGPYCKAIAKTDIGYTAYIGGQSGLLYRIDDIGTADGKSAIRISSSIPNSVKRSYIRGLVLDPTDDNILYVSMSSVSKEPRVWKVSDILTNNPVWESISGDLPEYLPANDIAISPIDPNYIAVGTDYGLYTTTDGGETWIRNETVPNVSVHQVKIRKDSKLFVFTHGRGMWSADFESKMVANNEHNLDLSISIYPNPVKSFMNVKLVGKWNVVRYEIISINAQLVDQKSVSNSTHNLRIDVSNYPKGSYVLYVYNKSDERISRKFVVE